MNLKKIGPMAFIAGVIIAILGGLFSSVAVAYQGSIGLLLVILGLLVGFLNIKDKEMSLFLIAAIALMVTSSVAGWAYLNDFASIGTIIKTILGYIGVFVAPAAVIVSLKAVFSVAKE